MSEPITLDLTGLKKAYLEKCAATIETIAQAVIHLKEEGEQIRNITRLLGIELEMNDAQLGKKRRGRPSKAQKSEHWTQTPKGRKIMRERMKARYAAKSKPPQSNGQGHVSKADAIIEVLSDAKAPLPLPRVVAALEARGYPFESERHGKAVDNTLRLLRKQGLVKTKGSGLAGERMTFTLAKPSLRVSKVTA